MSKTDPMPASPRHDNPSIILFSAPILLVVSTILTLTGITATLWYMAWWIAVAFCTMVVFSLFIVVPAVAGSQPTEFQKQGRERRNMQKIVKEIQEPDRKHG